MSRNVTRRDVLVEGEIVTLSLVPGDLLRSDLTFRDIAADRACGRSWDDGQSTGVTPTPAGRCPFEYEHTNSDIFKTEDAYRDAREDVPNATTDEIELIVTERAIVARNEYAASRSFRRLPKMV